MKLILSQYLRSLKERAEFDRLLPDLLFAMNYVPISRPQVGVRQFGVDLATVGTNEDGVDELLLVVIKRGDITRSNWDSGPQAVRASLNEVFDVYLTTHVDPAHKSRQKRIVVATTGDLKQDVEINWNGYVKEHANLAVINFWGVDRIASLIERYLLNENIFVSEDRMLLRKSLALSGEIDYDRKDLYKLISRQLGLGRVGQLERQQNTRELQKALRTVNLSTRIFSQWSEDEGNLKHALIASERAMLWSWHRINLESPTDATLYKEFRPLLESHQEVGKRYFEKLENHLTIKDGLAGYSNDDAPFSVMVFEQIGLLATIGLTQALYYDGEDNLALNFKYADRVAKGLASLLKNNPVSGSPRFDHNMIEIVLGLLLLKSAHLDSVADEWLTELVIRADYTFISERKFPISSDSFEDLADVMFSDDEDLRNSLKKTSWILPTLATWSVILNQNDLYEKLAKSSKNAYPEVCLQLWHPNKDCVKYMYFGAACDQCGEVEAPINLPSTLPEYRDMMKAILTTSRFDISKFSPACLAGMDALDLIAARHFRTPIAPSFWYSLLDTCEPPKRYQYTADTESDSSAIPFGTF